MSGVVVESGRRVGESMVRRLAHAVLVAAVRGRRERGGDWGEAVLAEFAETTGDREAVRWAAGGLRAVWLERRGRVRALPRHVRIRRQVVTVLVVAVVGGLAVDRWVLTLRPTLSGGMANTLEIGDRYLVDRVSFRLTGLHRGDVVDFRPADNHVRTRRVIGLPGDTIACADGRVLVNGSPVDEPYVPFPDVTDCAPVTVPPGKLYVLGDHRDVAMDSRQEGFVHAGDVEGRVLWP